MFLQLPVMKAVKNKVEQDGFRAAMLRDGVAVVKFLAWLKSAVEAGGQTEISLDDRLTALRAEQPKFKGISFDTIVGYGAHGAMYIMKQRQRRIFLFNHMVWCSLIVERNI